MVQKEVVQSITIKEGSIRGTEGNLVEVREEEILVEEDAYLLSVIIVINLDTWHRIVRIHVRRAHIT
jgi:hypothetical protein